MAWPPSPSSTTFTERVGTLPTTVAWGTDGIMSGAIVISFRSSQMAEEVKIENGSGLTATLIGLLDGETCEITCVDDRAITWPQFFDTVELFDPNNAGGGTIGAPINFQVISGDYNTARKQPGERVILAKKYTLVPVS
jgi:hypothetical protein